MMPELDYILCHGSSNRFVLLDAVRYADALRAVDRSALALNACRACGGLDGLLLLVQEDGAYGMQMFNPDGSRAEMCGNGIRCVARLAQRYIAADRFGLRSGGRRYELSREEPVYGDIPTYGVVIPVGFTSDDFRVSHDPGTGFVAGSIPQLDERLRFTYLHLGNPHLVAATEEIDLGLLERLGRRVTELPELFPQGINVSLFRASGDQRIFAATCERGAGITSSCGTAMTACSTAACLLGLCRYEEGIEVRNNGGAVRCLCRNDREGLRTTLVGNATFEADGVMSVDAATGAVTRCGAPVQRVKEAEAYAGFLAALKSC